VQLHVVNRNGNCCADNKGKNSKTFYNSGKEYQYSILFNKFTMSAELGKQISSPVATEKLDDNPASVHSISNDAAPDSTSTHYITGWRIRLITGGLVVALFIAMVEALIASTAVIAITDDLGGFDKSSWVFTAYLLTFCGFQMVYGKLSDLIGRKATILSALFIFTVFSGLCGASQTLDQL
jgi:hypothetical protein